MYLHKLGMRIVRFLKDFMYFACDKTLEILSKIIIKKIVAHCGISGNFLSNYPVTLMLDK